MLGIWLAVVSYDKGRKLLSVFPIFYLKVGMETVQFIAVNISSHPVFSPFVQISCPQTFVLGSLLDTERGAARTPRDTNYVLVCFSDTELSLGNVLRFSAFDTQNKYT